VGAAWVVQDLGSRNGTWVNGRPVTAEVALRSGDELLVGRSTLVLHVQGDGASRVTDVLEAPSLDDRQRQVVRALCRPLLEGDLLSTESSIEAVVAELGDDAESVLAVLGSIAELLGIDSGPPWGPLARTAVALGAVR